MGQSECTLITSQQHWGDSPYTESPYDCKSEVRWNGTTSGSFLCNLSLLQAFQDLWHFPVSSQIWSWGVDEMVEDDVIEQY